MREVNDDERIGGKNIVADELAETGPVTVRVASVVAGDFEDNGVVREKKILRFDDGTSLVLSKTKEKQIAALFGGPPTKSQLIGATLKLYAEKVPFGPKKVNSVQIGKPDANAKAAAPF